MPATLEEALAFLLRGDRDAVAGGKLPDVVLEETAARVVSRVTGLTSAAYAAITAQMDLLRELEREGLETLRADVDAGTLLEAIRKDWQARFRQRWSEKAEALETPYAGVTAPAAAALEKMLRQLYDTVLRETMDEVEQMLVRQAEPETAAEDAETPPVQAEPPPAAEETVAMRKESADEPEPEDDEEGTGRASAPDADPGQADRPMPDILLSLVDTGADRYRAILKISGETVADRAFDVGDPAAEADALFGEIEPFLDELLQAAGERAGRGRSRFGWRRSAPPPELSVHVVVESDAVRHRMSLLLQRRIETGLAGRVGVAGRGEGIMLRWEAGLEW